MRFLLANNHCISDPTAGVTHSLRTIVEWLAEAGHECHVLTTARFESAVGFSIEEHLSQRGVAVPRRAGERSPRRRSVRGHVRPADRPIVSYRVGAVPVTLLFTRHNDETRPDRAESLQYEAVAAQLLADFAPDQLIACNAHPMIRAVLAQARAAA